MAERTVVHDTIVAERTYGHPPDHVFAAWRDPATKREWFAEGEGWRIEEYGLDFRVGGREHGRFRRGNGPETRNETVYLDIVPNRRIVMAYTMAFDGSFGEPRASVTGARRVPGSSRFSQCCRCSQLCSERVNKRQIGTGRDRITIGRFSAGNRKIRRDSRAADRTLVGLANRSTGRFRSSLQHFNSAGLTRVGHFT